MPNTNIWIYTGDTGTLLTLDTGSNIATGSIFRIYYEDPNEGSGFFTASLNGTDNIQYTTTGTDFNIVGDWTLQAYVEYSGGSKFYGNKVQLEVKNNI